jgi:hypothetical protein
MTVSFHHESIFPCHRMFLDQRHRNIRPTTVSISGIVQFAAPEDVFVPEEGIG